jgi:hypothetical protein
MAELVKTQQLERRWPVVISILAVVVMFALLPQRIRLVPTWVFYSAFIIQVTILVAVAVTRGRRDWLKAERAITLSFSILAGLANIVNLSTIIGLMLNKEKEVTGLQLLTSGLGVWAGNLLCFSLLYWLVDRGGPGARANGVRKVPDWLFPQEGAPTNDTPHDWKPVYLDYLFLAYCSATAFSPTDVLPLTGRAKLLIMFESSVSLLTILVVLSRSINILG